MGLLAGLRDRIGAAVAAAAAAVMFLICGAIMAFVISPGQAVEWRRINNLPDMDVATINTMASGEAVVITGTLNGNEEIHSEGLVAYRVEEWMVSEPSSDDSSPSGRWDTVERNVPALNLDAAGGSIATLSNNSANLGGSLHEFDVPGTGSLSATDGDRQLADGATRTTGFRNGDLVTVVGQKASTGGVAPDRIFGGDKVQLVDSIRQGARAAFTIGIGMMICSPFVLVGGILAGLFGRRRRGVL